MHQYNNKYKIISIVFLTVSFLFFCLTTFSYIISQDYSPTTDYSLAIIDTVYFSTISILSLIIGLNFKRSK